MIRRQNFSGIERPEKFHRALRDISIEPKGLHDGPRFLFSVSLSAAEFLDRYLIYELKSQRAPEQGGSVDLWLDRVRSAYQAALVERPALEPLAEKLRAVHTELWDLESSTRAEGVDDTKFGILARAIFARNDERHRLKSAINTCFSGANIDHRHYDNR